MRLSSLLSALDPCQVVGPAGALISHITENSKEVLPGSLFVAIAGFRQDGHRYIPEAWARGAAAVVAERDSPPPPQGALVRVANSRSALARLAAAFYGHPSRKLRLVGITGTDGKTTTAFLLDSILRAAGRTTTLLSTVWNRVGEEVLPARLTTPDAASLQKLLSESLRRGAREAVMEVSSHAVALRRVEACSFAAGVLTHVSSDHLDLHGRRQEYLKHKAAFFHSLDGGAPGQAPWRPAAILNADDGLGGRLAEELRGPSVLTYGLLSRAGVRGTIREAGPGHLRLAISFEGESAEAALRLTGRYNAYNALAAAAAALALGEDLPTIARGLGSLPGVPGRFEFLSPGAPFQVARDYAHTVRSVVEVLREARGIAGGRVLVVLGCPGARDHTKRPKMAAAAASLADLVVITSDNPADEDPGEIAQEMLAGVEKHPGKARVIVLLDRRAAVERALEEAREGDLVMLLGKGHEDFQLVGDARLPFDEREVVEGWFAGRSAPRPP